MARNRQPDPLALRARLGAAIERERKGRRVTQTQLGRAAHEAQATISDYEKAKTAVPLDAIVAIEDALELDRGTLLIEAGYVDLDAVAAVEAIKRDGRIDDGFKERLLDFYRFAVERTAAGRLIDPPAHELAAIGPPFDDELSAQIWDDPELIDEHRRVLIWRHQRGLLRPDEDVGDAADDHHRRAS